MLYAYFGSKEGLYVAYVLADELSQLRGQIAQAVRRMLEAGASGLPGPAADGIAHAIVGAGESLANWWLDHPDVPRSEVADWYLEVVRAADLRNRRPVADRVPSAPHGAQGDPAPG